MVGDDACGGVSPGPDTWRSARTFSPHERWCGWPPFALMANSLGMRISSSSIATVVLHSGTARTAKRHARGTSRREPRTITDQPAGMVHRMRRPWACPARFTSCKRLRSVDPPAGPMTPLEQPRRVGTWPLGSWPLGSWPLGLRPWEFIGRWELRSWELRSWELRSWELRDWELRDWELRRCR